MDRDTSEKLLKKIIAKAPNMEPEEIKPQDTLDKLGYNDMGISILAKRICEEYKKANVKIILTKAELKKASSFQQIEILIWNKISKA